MVTVWIPPLLRELTNGEEKMEVEGKTVRDVVDVIDETYPGFKHRICENEQLIPELSVVVDGVVSQEKLKHKVDTATEIHFLPVLAGG